jgi:16S rRNA (uracil1498-N3)-methyltransferase
MMRFFVDSETINSDSPALLDENFKHAKVLRLKVGEEVTLCDGNCNEAVCTVEEITNEAVFLKVISRNISENEPAVKVSVFMALPKADKL